MDYEVNILLQVTQPSRIPPSDPGVVNRSHSDSVSFGFITQFPGPEQLDRGKTVEAGVVAL
jgi:hypothetical protein